MRIDLRFFSSLTPQLPARFPPVAVFKKTLEKCTKFSNRTSVLLDCASGDVVRIKTYRSTFGCRFSLTERKTDTLTHHPLGIGAQRD